MTPTQLIATILVPIALALLSAMSHPDPDTGLPLWLDVRTWPRLVQPVVPLLLAGLPVFAAELTAGSTLDTAALAGLVAGLSAIGIYHAGKRVVERPALTLPPGSP